MKKICLLLCLVLLIFCLSGCKSDDYTLAVTLQEAGAYAEAIEIYTALGEYEDATSRIAVCREALAQIEALSAAQADYDTAAQNLLQRNAQLTAAIESARAVRDSGTPLDPALLLIMDAAIDTAERALTPPLYAPREAEAMAAATEKMNAIHYETFLTSLEKQEQHLAESISLFSAVSNPSEEYIIFCLSNVPGITGIGAATEDNDPNNNLNKDGGYTSAVFFSHENISKTAYSPDAVLDNGTKCGGCIEVYRTIEDAKMRNEYLAAFDGTILDSGSHTVLGTIVIRTSYKMTATQQDDLEAAILAALLPSSQ